MLRHLSADCNGAQIAEALRADGAVIIDDVADSATMDAVDRELAPFIEATPYSGDAFGGFRTKRTGSLISRSPTCRDLVMHPLIREATNSFLEHATNHQLHLTQVISIEPGQEGQPVHRDQWAFDFFPFPKGYDVQLNTIWALTEFTEENGATRVVPGSNQAEDKLRFKHGDTVAAEMTRGSVLVYSGSVYHGGGANNSDAVRRGINITYNLGFLRQEENQYLATPPEIARDLDDDLLQLMGYSMGAYALGYVGDLVNPLTHLRSPDGVDGTDVRSLGGGTTEPSAKPRVTN